MRRTAIWLIALAAVCGMGVRAQARTAGVTSPFRPDPSGASIFPPTACEPIEELPYLH